MTASDPQLLERARRDFGDDVFALCAAQAEFDPGALTPEVAQGVSRLVQVLEQVRRHSVLNDYDLESLMWNPAVVSAAYGGGRPSIGAESEPVLNRLLEIAVDAYPVFLISLGMHSSTGTWRPSLSLCHRYPDLERDFASVGDLAQLFNFNPDDRNSGKTTVEYNTGSASSQRLERLPEKLLLHAFQQARIEAKLGLEGFIHLVKSVFKEAQSLKENGSTSILTVHRGLGLPGDEPIDLGDMVLMPWRPQYGRFISLPPAAPQKLGDEDWAGFLCIHKNAAEFAIGQNLMSEHFYEDSEYDTTQGITARRSRDLSLAAFLTFSDGHSVGMQHSLTTIRHWLGNQGMKYTDERPTSTPVLATPREIDTLIEWYRKISTTPDQRAQIGFSRLLQAINARESYEDMTVDAVIFWEALLGTDSELTFRISISIAAICASTSADRKLMQDRVKKVYSYRSNIVHGGSKVNHQKSAVAAAEAIAISRELLESIYLKMPELLSVKIDTEEIIFAEPTEKPVIA